MNYCKIYKAEWNKYDKTYSDLLAFLNQIPFLFNYILDQLL